jgi:hypothetical protein
MPSQNEAFSRILIDKALEFSGWDLLERREMMQWWAGPFKDCNHPIILPELMQSFISG